MEFVSEVKEKRVLNVRGVLEGEYEGEEIRMNGAVHTIRHTGEIAFVILRKSRGLVQCVYEAGGAGFDIRDLREESATKVTGVAKAEERAPQGFKIKLKGIRVLSQPTKPLPLAVNKWKLNTSLETKLSLRPISLRSVRERAKFKIQEGTVRGFRNYLLSQGFTEIRTPKVVARGAEGGSNIFKLEYLNRKAGLGQSPQFYKQTMVGICDRAFEAAPVFRTEKHNITRHLNEYANLDFEMRYVDNSWSMMDMKTGMLQYVMRPLEQEYKKELDMLGATLPEVGRIPAVQSDQAKELVSRKYDRKVRNPYDLEPKEELPTGRYLKEEYGGGFVFVIHYPSKKWPFYAMNGPEDPKFTLSSNLMLRGLEVTIGGQRIHDYREITDKMEKRGMDPGDIASYLMIFKYGMPPHGGLGIGLKRLTMRLLDEQNVREASMSPGDITRLEPQGQENDWEEQEIIANIISGETIEYIGILAKLELSPEGEEGAKTDMGRMLDYIDKLNELDIQGVKPMSHVFPVNNVFREDVVTSVDQRNRILSNVPRQKDGVFKVSKIVEQEE